MNNKLPKIIAVIVAIAGISVMIGWFFDITILKSISAQFVTMKFITAIGFVLSSITLYCVAKINQKKQDGIVLVLIFINFIIILMMFSLIISAFVGIKTGMEDLFVKEAQGAVNTLVPGRPALTTMFLFVIIAGIGFLSLFEKFNRMKRMVFVLGMFIVIFGSLAVIGYVTDMPSMYGRFNEGTTGMALNTAILFIILGVGFISVYHKNNRKII